MEILLPLQTYKYSKVVNHLATTDMDIAVVNLIATTDIDIAEWYII